MINGAKMYFRYDEAGRPFSVSYGSLSYYYILNQQGDVVGLRGINGATAVNYKYDAWGNIISITDANGNAVTSGIGIMNPLRYRGYFYDTETKLYYLQSRYYSPELRRFICGDIGIEILLIEQGNILGANVFLYCENNPVNSVDPDGRITIKPSYIEVKETITLGWAGQFIYYVRYKVYGGKKSVDYYIYNGKKYYNTTQLGNAFYNKIFVEITDKKVNSIGELHRLSDVNILARTIFAEANNTDNGLWGVACCIVTRIATKGKCDSKKYPKEPFKSVCLKSGQFSTMWNERGVAMNPQNNAQTRWKNAKRVAAKTYLGVVYTPRGYNGQVEFRDSHMFNRNLKNYNSAKRTGKYKGKNVKNICTLGDNTFFDYA